MAGPRIAVLLPCFNEEAAIVKVITGFRKALPDAAIYVYDNNSRDRTAEKAKKAGAIVRTERQQGKDAHRNGLHRRVFPLRAAGPRRAAARDSTGRSLAFAPPIARPHIAGTIKAPVWRRLPAGEQFDAQAAGAD